MQVYLLVKLIAGEKSGRNAFREQVITDPRIVLTNYGHSVIHLIGFLSSPIVKFLLN